MLKLRLLAVLWIIGTTLLTALAAPHVVQTKTNSLANTVLLIIRHAEKPESGVALAPKGEKRAAAYVQYFKRYRVDGRPVHLTHLIAASDSEGSYRPRLTLEPLAKSLHQSLDLRFSDKDPYPLVQELKTHNLGHEVLICWRHGEIPALLTALGVDSSPFVSEGRWPGSVYDRVIELHFNAEGKLSAKLSKLIKEHLLAGDED
jgi:hypothetical protein